MAARGDASVAPDHKAVLLKLSCSPASGASCAVLTGAELLTNDASTTLLALVFIFTVQNKINICPRYFCKYVFPYFILTKGKLFMNQFRVAMFTFRVFPCMPRVCLVGLSVSCRWCVFFYEHRRVCSSAAPHCWLACCAR